MYVALEDLGAEVDINCVLETIRKLSQFQPKIL
jgi:hypothetical protein